VGLNLLQRIFGRLGFFMRLGVHPDENVTGIEFAGVELRLVLGDPKSHKGTDNASRGRHNGCPTECSKDGPSSNEGPNALEFIANKRETILVPDVGLDASRRAYAFPIHLRCSTNEVKGIDSALPRSADQ
jgi:hypothetical protein